MSINKIDYINVTVTTDDMVEHKAQSDRFIDFSREFIQLEYDNHTLSIRTARIYEVKEEFICKDKQ